jgi:hypothetical protein
VSRIPTNPPPELPEEALLEAYLDDALVPSARAAFEARLTAEPRLAAALSLQRQINESLSRSFVAPGAETLRISSAGATRPGAASRPATPRWMYWAVSGLAAAVAVIGLNLLAPDLFGRGHATRVYPIAYTSPAALYQSTVAAGFKPEEVCTTDDQFKNWVQTKYGEPLVPASHPDGIQYVGWSYAKATSLYTGVLLAKVDNQPVLVLLDTTASQQHTPQAKDMPRGLHLYPATIGSLTLYEISPLPEPRITPILHIEGK